MEIDEKFLRLNPLCNKGFFLLVWCNRLGIVHCTFIGVSGYNFKKILHFLSEDLFYFSNSVDPDEMPHDAAFHLGLHCLQKYLFRRFSSLMQVSFLYIFFYFKDIYGHISLHELLKFSKAEE